MGLKIIHTTCHTQFGGLEKRIYNESCWMAEKGHDIIIVAPPNTPLSEKSKNKGFATVGMAFKSSSFLNDFFKLRQLFRTTRPHILNTHGNEDSKIALTAAIGSGIPIKILSRHISAHVRNSRHNRILYKKLCHYIFTTCFIVSSTYSANLMLLKVFFANSYPFPAIAALKAGFDR